MKTCPYCGKENDDGAEQCIGCATPLGVQQAATALAKATACPLCGKSDGYELSVPIRRSFSWLVFILGGFIIAAVHSASRKQRVKCNGCGGFFYVSTGTSKAFLVILIILIALVLLGWIGLFAN